MPKRRRIEITKFRHRKTIIFCAAGQSASPEISQPEKATTALDEDLWNANDAELAKCRMTRTLLKKLFEVKEDAQ